MTTTEFNTIMQVLGKLSAGIEELRENQKNFATKKDLERFATKKDLERYATKEDLKRFATKEDLKKFATKDDLNEMAHTILNAMSEPFAKLENTVNRNHEKRLRKLEDTSAGASS